MPTKRISPTQQKVIEYLSTPQPGHEDILTRYGGGYWARPGFKVDIWGVPAPDKTAYFATGTVSAMVKAGVLTPTPETTGWPFHRQSFRLADAQ
jgi:hypothetical protein